MGTCLNCTPTREGVSGVSSALTCAAKALAREPLCSPPRCMPLRFPALTLSTQQGQLQLVTLRLAHTQHVAFTSPPTFAFGRRASS